MKTTIIVLALTAILCADFTFLSFADTRGYYNDGLVSALPKTVQWSPKFAICPGDMDPVATNDGRIRQYLGSAFCWFNAVGNHETEASSDMTYTGNLPLRAVNQPAYYSDFIAGPSICPKTTYSIVYTDEAGIKVQIICLDGYTRNSTNYYAQMTQPLLTWLSGVLANSSADYIFVLGHPPVFPKNRHTGDSWNHDNTTYLDDMWNLLVQHKASCYFAGHTHYNYWMAVDNYTNWETQDASWSPDRGCIQMDCGALRDNDANTNDAIIIKVEVKRDNAVYTVYKVTSSALSIKGTFTQKRKREPSGIDQMAVIPTSRFSVTSQPNPFHAQVKITVSGVDPEMQGNMMIYNISGKLIQKVAFSDMRVNTHNRLWYSFRAGNIPCGIYLIKVTAGSKTAQTNLVYLK